MDIRELQGYASLLMSIFFVVMLYSYIVYLYRSEKKGEKDYEKLGRIAIDDELDSTPINTSSAKPSEKRSEKNE
jgi:cytochrome c oxidase cbb3-type subunit 4